MGCFEDLMEFRMSVRDAEERILMRRRPDLLKEGEMVGGQKNEG